MSSIPTVIIANIAEAFMPFLGLDDNAQDQRQRIAEEHFLADRAVFWDFSAKLLIAPYEIPSYKYTQETLGIPGVLIHPQRISSNLCSDIINDQSVLEQIVHFSGAGRKIKLIHYAATASLYELVDILERDLGLVIESPETPNRVNAWLQQELDSKVGFRSLIGRMVLPQGVQLPEGYICHGIDETLKVIEWYRYRSKPCVVKANLGESGFGNFFFFPNDSDYLEQVKKLLYSWQLRNDMVIVENYISAKNSLYPSFEAFVPGKNDGPPRMAYISNQLFNTREEFIGVIIDRSYEETPWYKRLQEAGMAIALTIQDLGYVGFFDLDAIVDEDNKVWLLEINARRTGGTHAHSFATNFFGANYNKHSSILSKDSVSLEYPMNIDQVLTALSSILYIPGKNDRGVVITVSSSLPEARLGVLLVARNMDEVLFLDGQLERHLKGQ